MSPPTSLQATKQQFLSIENLYFTSRLSESTLSYANQPNLLEKGNLLSNLLVTFVWKDQVQSSVAQKKANAFLGFGKMRTAIVYKPKAHSFYCLLYLPLDFTTYCARDMNVILCNVAASLVLSLLGLYEKSAMLMFHYSSWKN